MNETEQSEFDQFSIFKTILMLLKNALDAKNFEEKEKNMVSFAASLNFLLRDEKNRETYLKLSRQFKEELLEKKSKSMEEKIFIILLNHALIKAYTLDKNVDKNLLKDFIEKVKNENAQLLKELPEDKKNELKELMEIRSFYDRLDTIKDTVKKIRKTRFEPKKPYKGKK